MLSLDVDDLADALNSIDCRVDTETVAGWPEPDRTAAAEWAAALMLDERPLPPRPAFLAAIDSTRCRVCGCTDAMGCPDGCYWFGFDLCSLCAPRCSSAGCANPALGCYHLGTLLSDPPDEFLCAEHAQEAGYCSGCGDFIAGGPRDGEDFCEHCEAEIESDCGDDYDDAPNLIMEDFDGP